MGKFNSCQGGVTAIREVSQLSRSCDHYVGVVMA